MSLIPAARLANARAVTLMELLIALSLLGLTLLAAMPSMTRFVQKHRLQAAARRLQIDLMFTRAEAINSHRPLVICPTRSAESCDGGNRWHQGWIIFHDKNGNRKRQLDEALVRVGPPLENVNALSSAHRKRVRFYPNGTAPGTALTITFCDSRGSEFARAIVVANSGRIRSRSAVDNGVELECT